MNEKKKEILTAIEDDMEPWMPRTGNVLTLNEAAAEGAVTFEEELQQVTEGLTLQDAQTKAEIEEIASTVEKFAAEDESVTVFRNRVLAAFRKLSNRSTARDILAFCETLFQVPRSEILLENVDGKPTFLITVPQDVGTSVGSIETAADLLLDISASTYNAKIRIIGTLGYITPEQYMTDSYDPDKGYATLDNNDDVTEGGTYSGLT